MSKRQHSFSIARTHTHTPLPRSDTHRRRKCTDVLFIVRCSGVVAFFSPRRCRRRFFPIICWIFLEFCSIFVDYREKKKHIVFYLQVFAIPPKIDGSLCHHMTVPAPSLPLPMPPVCCNTTESGEQFKWNIVEICMDDYLPLKCHMQYLLGPTHAVGDCHHQIFSGWFSRLFFWLFSSVFFFVVVGFFVSYFFLHFFHVFFFSSFRLICCVG